MPEQFISCGLCDNYLSNPKLLDCLHSFCKVCLRRYVANTNVNTDDNSGDNKLSNCGEIVCPVCDNVTKCNAKQLTNVAHVSKLKSSEFVSSVTQAVRYINSLNITECSTCNSRPIQGNRSGGVCDKTGLNDELDRVNVGWNDTLCWCLDCELAVCSSCMGKHSDVDIGKRHDMILTDQLIQNYMKSRRVSSHFCGSHPDEKAHAYCLNCRTLTCPQCTVLKHKKHQCVPSKDALSLILPELRGVKQKLKTYHTDIHEVRNTIPAYLDKAAAKAEKDIHEFFNRLIDLLQKKRKELLDELGLIHEVEEGKAIETAERHDRNCRSSHNMHMLLRYLLKYGTNEEILEYYGKIRRHDIVKDIIQQDRLARFTFYERKAMAAIVQGVQENITLDVSYFQGDYVAKALKLIKSSSKRVPMKCREADSKSQFDGVEQNLLGGKRCKSIGNLSTMLNDNANGQEDVPKSVKLGTHHQATNIHKQLPTLTTVEFDDNFEPVTKGMAGSKLPEKERNTTNFHKRAAEKQTSLLKSSRYTSVPDITKLAKSDDCQPNLKYPELIESHKHPIRSTNVTKSFELNDAFQRLRRLAKMDGPLPSPNLSRTKQVFGSMSNLSVLRKLTMETDSKNDVAENIQLRHVFSPTAMVIEAVSNSLVDNKTENDNQVPSSADLDFEFDDLESVSSDSRSRNVSESEFSDKLSDLEMRKNLVSTKTFGSNSTTLVINDRNPVYLFDCNHKGNTRDQGNDNCAPTGIAALPNNRVVVADTAKRLVLSYTFNGTYLDSFRLDGENNKPRDVAAVSANEIAVLYQERHLVVFLSVEELFSVKQTFQTEKGYVAICSYNSTNLVMTCIFPSVIDAVNYTGEIIWTINLMEVIPLVDNALYLNPWYVASTVHKEIVISEHSKRLVVCFSSDHTVKFIFRTDEDSFPSPRGVCTDIYGNIVVVDDVSGDVRTISSDGRQSSIVLDSNDINGPLNVTFSYDGQYLILMQQNGVVKIFSTQYENAGHQP